MAGFGVSTAKGLRVEVAVGATEGFAVKGGVVATGNGFAVGIASGATEGFAGDGGVVAKCETVARPADAGAAGTCALMG